MSRQTLTIEDLKDRLLAQLDGLVHHLAPPAPGSYTKAGLYATLNPGRADRNVGSFFIHMTGQKAGRWEDYATGEHGDVLDLIGLSLGISDPVGKIKAAREWLGLDTEDPATRRAREELAARKKAERERQAAREQQIEARKREIARGLWFSGQETIEGTPVDHYLAGRDIDIRTLPHLSGAIRFHSECRYYFSAEITDPETGEVTRQTRWRALPAMVTAIARQGEGVIDCHRTYLERRPDGAWVKAALDEGDVKKVFTDYSGGSIRLCGETGPRGGQLKLAQAPAGSTVWVTEGIENGLALVALRALTGRPPAFVIAAGALFNFARVELPANVAEVVLAADNDSGIQAQAQLGRAIEAHRNKGRRVRVWRSEVPGEDLNDALRRALKEQEEVA